MNNKGFGLSEVLGFIGLSMFILIVIALYLNRRVGNNIYNDYNKVIVEEQLGVEPIIIDKSNEYLEIEKELEIAAKKYSFDEKHDTIITLKQLQNSRLIGEVLDPNDSTIRCEGYVKYIADTNTYQPNIACNGMYATSTYDGSLLKN